MSDRDSQRNVLREQMVNTPKETMQLGRRKQYGSARFGRGEDEERRENARRLNEEQSEGKQNMKQKALRFPRGERVMPPAVWGL